jgi:tRNA-dihydrouridine synthase A
VEDTAKTGISVEELSDSIDRRVSVAPMMDWTDRHCRYFLRQFSPHTRLYTEMLHAAAIVRGNAAALLRFSAVEQPLAIQLGGADPAQLALAARRAEAAGFVEVNLNCGCPSDRVRSGAFGACLMLQPLRVAECIAAMKAAVTVPVTVKFRIGVVDTAMEGPAAALASAQRFSDADAAALEAFARAQLQAGADLLVVHARKAVLGGLSPHENRTVPPLRHEEVARLRAALASGGPARGAAVPVVVNGGFRTCADVVAAQDRFDGVMIGREAYHRPELLGELHNALHPGDPPAPGAQQVLEAMHAYAARETAAGTPLHAITRHMLGLLSGRPCARALRKLLSSDVQHGAPVEEIFRRAMELAASSQSAIASQA